MIVIHNNSAENVLSAPKQRVCMLEEKSRHSPRCVVLCCCTRERLYIADPRSAQLHERDFIWDTPGVCCDFS